MSRASAPPPVILPPSNNAFTALTMAALLAVVFGLVVLFLRAQTLGVKLF